MSADLGQLESCSKLGSSYLELKPFELVDYVHFSTVCFTIWEFEAEFQ